MKKILAVFAAVGVLIACAFAAVEGLIACTATPPLPSRAAWESYDQERLKRDDHGCPKAVFIAPHGDLIQCQLVVYGPTSVKGPPEFDTPELAAIAGFRNIASKSTALYYEWGGQIVKMPSGKFAALEPNTDFAGDSVMIRSHSSFGLNAQLVAHYHTHPCISEHDVEFFSPPDLQRVLFGRLIAFMGDFCTGTVHEFKPGDKPDAEPAHDAGLWLSKGCIIGPFTEPHVMIVAE